VKINTIYNMDVFDFLGAVPPSSVDLAVIDPPYNMRKADWDTFDCQESYFEFTFRWINQLIPALKPTASVYLFNTPYNSAFILRHLVNAGLIFQNWITWDKRDGFNSSTKRYTHGQETILFFTKSTEYTFNADAVRVPYESPERIAAAQKTGLLKNGKRWYPNPAGRLCGEVWHITSERHKRKVNGKVTKLGHLTPKPQEMIERIIKASSNAGDLVLDCFVGSGTTAICCAKLGRGYICSDADPACVALANRELSQKEEAFNSMLSNIQSGNKSLEFIDGRISSDKYRGDESSEHNRYDMEEIHTIASLLNKYAPNGRLMRIRDTDLSKRAYNTPEEKDYALFCGEVSETAGKGTQDSIRKNIFVDMHRMGLLGRFDKNKKPAAIGQRVKFAALTEAGLRFANETNILRRRFMYTKALDKLLGGYIETALRILLGEDYGIDYISKYEFMFFVSAIDCAAPFSLTTAECAGLISEYRRLSPVQRKAVVETLKDKLKPENFPGDKTDKRDWHNWQNKIDQAYHLFGQTVYFDVSGENKEKLTLSATITRTESGEIVVVDKKRSAAVKYDYYKHHKIEGKTPGFELHHIIPLSWAESPEQFKLFDDWRNLVYIDAFSHAKITQNRNKNVLMSGIDNDIILSDYSENSVLLRYEDNIRYHLPLQRAMLEYNKQLNQN
jgi:site-specific DNA-methyltransferase (adenine-specific)